MSAVRPLPIEVELADELIVLTIDDEVADTTVAHLPEPRRVVDGRLVMRWADYDFPPAQWTTACGLDGWVYNRGGSLADVPICQGCLEALA